VSDDCSRNCIYILTHLVSNDNYATLVEVLQPNKTDVLPYLSGTSGPPSRWARVLIAQGADEIAYAANYMVTTNY
jgi:primary-amine oxidase